MSGGVCPRCALEGALFGAGARMSIGHASDAAGVAGSTDAGRFLPRPGGAIAHFELLDELGRGAMGQVWLARDPRLDRLVALKTLPAEFGRDPVLGARLEREARTAAALRHPHIVAVHDLGRAGDAVWLAMEFLEGGDLRARVQQKLLSPQEAARLGWQLAQALGHAHRAGVLHRDLKPSNVLLDERGLPKLGDFGLAASRTGGSDLTVAGQILGTPAYMAPEVLRGATAPAPAGDLYSLGAVLYETLTGRPPFVGDTPAAVLTAVLARDPVSPAQIRADLPRDLETIVLKCLEKDPARRYASAEALESDLAAFLEGRPISARPLSPLGRGWRWARREPVLAGALAATATLLVAVAVTATIAAVQIDRARRRATDEALRAARAEAETREELRSALLARARANRLSARTGQRFETLETVQAAVRIRPGEDLREEAILALTLPDVRTTRNDMHARDNGNQALALDVERARFAVEFKPGEWEIHAVADNRRLLTLTGGGEARAESAPQFSPDGRYFFVRTEAGRTLVWSIESPTAPIVTLTERTYALHRIVRGYGAPDAISPDGTRLVSALDGGGFSVHELPSGRELARVPTPYVLTHLVFSRDGRRLAVGRGLRGPKGEARFSLATTTLEQPQELHELPVSEGLQSIDWSGDGRLLLLGGRNSIAIDAESGLRVLSVRDPDGDFAFFGPTDRMVLTVGKSGSLRAWDLTTGETLLRGVYGSNSEIAFSTDRRRLLRPQGSTDLAAATFELPEIARTFPAVSSDGWDNTSRLGTTLAFSPDGRRLAQCVWGAIYLRDVSSGRVLATLNCGTPNDFSSAVFSADGRTLYVGSEAAGLLRCELRESADGAAVKFDAPVTLDAEQGYILTDATEDRRRLLLIDHRRTQQVKVLTLSDDAAKAATPPAASVSAVRWKFPQPSRAVFLDEGRTALVNGMAGIGKLPLELFDAVTGSVTRAIGADVMQGYEASRSADGRWVLFGTGSQTSELRRTSDWSKGPALGEKFQGAGKTSAFSPDGKLVAIAAGATIHLVRLEDGAVLARLAAVQSGTYATDLAWSPDGNRLAVLWRLGALTLWDLDAAHRELAALRLDW